MRIILIHALSIVFVSFFPHRKFPAIDHNTIEGTRITNDHFKGKRTLVITCYLGCGVAMRMLKDMEEMPDSSRSRIIVVLENTPQQVKEFNAGEKNKWSSIRNYFKLEPLSGSFIAECRTSNITASEAGDTIIGEQCRELTAKIKTYSSPTLIYVDEEGYIYKKRKGYFGDEDRKERLENMLKPLRGR